MHPFVAFHLTRFWTQTVCFNKIPGIQFIIETVKRKQAKKHLKENFLNASTIKDTCLFQRYVPDPNQDTIYKGNTQADNQKQA